MQFGLALPLDPADTHATLAARVSGTKHRAFACPFSALAKAVAYVMPVTVYPCICLMEQAPLHVLTHPCTAGHVCSLPQSRVWLHTSPPVFLLDLRAEHWLITHSLLVSPTPTHRARLRT
jgi:hypothetical protein